MLAAKKAIDQWTGPCSMCVYMWCSVCHMLHYMYTQHWCTHPVPEPLFTFSPPPTISTHMYRSTCLVYTDHHHHWWRPLEWGRNVWSTDKGQLSNSSPASVVPKIVPCRYLAKQKSSNMLRIIISWCLFVCVCMLDNIEVISCCHRHQLIILIWLHCHWHPLTP